MALQEITAALGGLKAATELARAFGAAKGAIDVAEYKLKAADLMSSLADARIALVEAQEKSDQLDAEIKMLRDALDAKEQLIRAGDGYYALDDNGEPTGGAFCLRCWEVDHKQYHLIYPRRTDEPTICQACKSKYAYFRTSRKE
jgi:hypothetical protein